MFDVVVVGGGPAGLTAAVYALRRGMKTVVVTPEIGGRVMLAHHVENYPGFISITGPDLVKKMEEQIRKNHPDCDFVMDSVYDVKKVKGFFEILLKSRKKISGKSVIIATGTEDKSLKIKGEREFLGKGVTYCSTCDSPLFRNKVVAVVGGGNSALVGVQEVSPYASKVYLIHRRSEFRGDVVEVERVKKLRNAEFVLDEEVMEVYGDTVVKGLKLKSGKNLKVDGLFIEIGVTPLTQFIKKLGVKVTSQGFVEVNDKQETSVDGVFAAGDITTKNANLLQIVHATSEGAIAGFFASTFVNDL
ncbi:MAG: FAD-dependent oxidoreductase [Nanoarchaeota archaeon]|nr:FAD-dependent oxidoreductase [Nanoarchaeota archaeon]